MLLLAVLVVAGLNLAPASGHAGAPTCAGETATIVGTDAADRLIGTAKRDVIVGRGGNDVVQGRGGNDRICGGRGADQVSGGGGSDHVFGNSGRDTLSGEHDARDAENPAGDHETSFTVTRDVVRGGSGQDLLFDGRGDDRLFGGPGADQLLMAWNGVDRADGGQGHDRLVGESEDLLLGRSGDDLVTLAPSGVGRGGDGKDSFFVSIDGSPPALVHGGAGHNDLSVSFDRDFNQAVTVETDLVEQVLRDGEDEARLVGITDVSVSPSDQPSADVWQVTGNDADNEFHVLDLGRQGVIAAVIDAGAGDDDIRTGFGDDTIGGGSGTDTADAGWGTDTCYDIEAATSCETSTGNSLNQRPW